LIIGRGRQGYRHTLTSARTVFLRALLTQFRLIRNQWVNVAKPRYSWDICRVAGAICYFGQRCGQQTGAKLTGGRADIVELPSRQRSAVSNGSRLFVAGDGNSAWSRRFRDLVAQHAADLGGADHLSEAQLSLIRRVATIETELEQREGELSRGMAVDLDQYGRAAGQLRRLLETLGTSRQVRNITPTLSEYLAAKAAR
jgi:hypothetical protein